MKVLAGECDEVVVLEAGFSNVQAPTEALTPVQGRFSTLWAYV
jgi:hypothetical protein